MLFLQSQPLYPYTKRISRLASGAVPASGGSIHPVGSLTAPFQAFTAINSSPEPGVAA